MLWEFAILDALQKIHAPILDTLFKAITKLGDGGIFWITLAIILLFFEKTRICGICMLVALVMGALVTNVVLKPLVARPRPFQINDSVRLLVGAPHDYSFPSGHSQASFAAATAIYCNYKKWGIAALILAGLIAFSRLYLYVHFPTDVLAGMLIGIAIGALISRYVKEKTEGRRKERN